MTMQRCRLNITNPAGFLRVFICLGVYAVYTGLLLAIAKLLTVRVR